MSDFPTGAIVDDDLDFSAAPKLRKDPCCADAKDPPGRPRAQHRHRRVGRRDRRGLALWACSLPAAWSRPACATSTRGASTSRLFMFLVGLSAGGLIISSVPRAFGMKGSAASRRWRCGRPSAARCSPSASWWSTWASRCACGSCSRTPTWAARSCGTSSCLAPTSSCPSCTCGRTLRAEAGKVSDTALRVISVVALGVRRARALGDRLDLRPAAGSRDVAYRASRPLVRILGAGVRHGARARAWSSRCARRATSSCEQANFVKLAKLLGAFVMVDLYFFGCDLLTEGFPAGSGRRSSPC